MREIVRETAETISSLVRFYVSFIFLCSFFLNLLTTDLNIYYLYALTNVFNVHISYQL
jgi:hypothetical protein